MSFSIFRLSQILNTTQEKQHSAWSGKQELPILLSSGIPAKLVKREEDGLYIEMSELLPHHLSSAELNTSNQSTTLKSKHYKIATLWIIGFNVLAFILPTTLHTGLLISLTIKV